VETFFPLCGKIQKSFSIVWKKTPIFSTPWKNAFHPEKYFSAVGTPRRGVRTFWKSQYPIANNQDPTEPVFDPRSILGHWILDIEYWILNLLARGAPCRL